MTCETHKCRCAKPLIVQVEEATVTILNEAQANKQTVTVVRDGVLRMAIPYPSSERAPWDCEWCGDEIGKCDSSEKNWRKCAGPTVRRLEKEVAELKATEKKGSEGG